jgi:hypothetical protein
MARLGSKLGGRSTSAPAITQGGPEVYPGQALVGDPEQGIPAPVSVLQRIEKGESVIKRHEPRWRELWAHMDGEQFAYVSARDGQLTTLETREGGSKPSWRPRLTRNRMTKAIVGEVSILTSRFPAYECTPLNTDPEKMNAARTAEKVLLSLHESLGVRRIVFKVGLNAAVTGDGYAWPYWNSSLGDPVAPEKVMPPAPKDGEEPAPMQVGLRTGEISVAVLRQEQVGWEPGVEFEDSRWYFVRLTKPVDEVTGQPGYIGPKVIVPDARADRLGSRDSAAAERNLCFVYHFLERPSDAAPQGRWMEVCQGRITRPVREYPCASDRPVIQRMPWIDRGDRRDRSMGLGEMVIDIQRTINRICNQMITWRNLVLNPQILAHENDLRLTPSDEPGKIYRWRGQHKPEWREVQDTPATMYKDLELAYSDMDFIIGQGASIPTDMASGSGIQALNEREQSYRSMLLGNLAGFYGNFGHALIYLVAKHYTEERLLEVKGRFGVETIPDFVGAVLDDKIASVRVAEASIEPRTRASQEAKIMLFADKQWISPQRAMSALQGGLADAIIDDFELDIARVHRQIQQLCMLGKDPELQRTPDPSALIPEAKPYDNHEVFVDIIKGWMKTPDFENEAPLIQEAALNWLEMHEFAIQEKAMQDAAQLNTQAEAQGQQNAGKDQGAPKPMASRPSMASEAAALGAPQ